MYMHIFAWWHKDMKIIFEWKKTIISTSTAVIKLNIDFTQENKIHIFK